MLWVLGGLSVAGLAGYALYRAYQSQRPAEPEQQKSAAAPAAGPSRSEVLLQRLTDARQLPSERK